MSDEFIPFYKPYIDKKEINSVVESMESGWLTTGPKVKEFQNKFADYVGSKHALAVNSCTAGLHLLLVAAGIGEGDEVITTSMTFAATANVIVEVGAKPVLVDIDPKTFNMDIQDLERKITDKTKAIIPVHMAGQPCEMDEIMKLAKERDIYVFEDAAHAIWTKYKGKMVGNISDGTAFSFYATKNLCTGEGGMVTTNNDELAENIRINTLHGISRDAYDRYTNKEASWYYEIVTPGYKYNMPDINAAMGIEQLNKLEEMQKRRKEIADIYTEAFKEVPEVKVPYVKDDIRHAWHLYIILLEVEMLKIDRNEFINKLTELNLGTSVHFIPIHFHPYYKENYGFEEGDFPNCEYVFERNISLPFYPAMTDEQVYQVIDRVKQVIEEVRR
ncbi:DegT/DnrJ/EryC1/StrS family aminotransferase [Natroniella sp. ANB-PHB2]|uniref:DegT/DnrJ/EryC1/StrS family aminotransferase n=1 Tax=Natroniella sp. ANB-PHB2 TaxID=3384444 RepID=UPI0038D4728C